jgi:hypothetical protein
MLLIPTHKREYYVIIRLDLGSYGNTASSLILLQMKHGRRRT